LIRQDVHGWPLPRWMRHGAVASRLRGLSIKQRLRWLLVFSLGCFALCGLIGVYILSTIRVNGPIYERIKSSQDLVADILPPPAYIVEPYLITRELAEERNPEQRQILFNRLVDLHRAYQARYAYWSEAGLEGELGAKFLRESDVIVHAFFATAFTDLAHGLDARDDAAIAQAMRKLKADYLAQRAVIEQVVRLAHQRSAQDEAAASHRIRILFTLLGCASLLILALFVGIFLLVDRSITNPINEAVRVAREIAAGDLNLRFRRIGDDETGQLLMALRDIVNNIQRELIRSEKMAALGTLVAGVAHEMNTPLSNGLMAVSTLDDETRAFRSKAVGPLRRTDWEAYMQTVAIAIELTQRNLERAAGLVASFKQVAVDRASSQRRRFILRRVVDEIVQTLRPTLKRLPIQIEIAIPEPIILDSFPGPLGQVLTNLIENAAIHAFDGRPGVIRVAARVDAAQCVVLDVADDGVGIAPALRERVFEPFFTTRMGSGGSGLGLYIVHNIVYEVLGGALKLSSTPGLGSTFELTIPLDAPPAVAPPSA